MAVLDWTEAAMASVNQSSRFRELGSVDVDVVLCSGKHQRRVSFRDFGVARVEDCTGEDLIDEPLVISMPTVSWNSYLHKRRIGVAPSLIGLDVEKSIITARNSQTRRHFDRVHRSVQAFVDAGAGIT